MSKFKFMKAMGLVEDRILERYMKVEKQLTAPQGRIIWSRLTAVAACLVVVATVLFLSVLHIQNPTQTPQTRVYTAQEIAKMLNRSSYQTVTVSDPAELDLSPIPTQETITVYQNKRIPVPLDEAALREFADGILAKFCAALGTQIPEYTVEQRSYKGSSYYIEGERNPYSDSYLQVTEDFDNLFLQIKQAGSHYHFTLRGTSTESTRQFLQLNGERISIDTRQSDEDILASLEGFQKMLNEIFDVSLSDAKLSREGALIRIRFYNEDAYSLNQHISSSEPDSLQIMFYPDNATDSNIYATSVNYSKNLVPPEEAFEATAVKMLSLSEAEALLQKGYAFGAHSCPTCLEDPEHIRFDEYDLVNFVYYTVLETVAPVFPVTDKVIPFYVFYKEIETNENGTTYAYAYVPAIEVEGMEEFFTSAQSYHNKN